MAAMKPVDVGAVCYLNTKPLIRDLESLAPGANVILDTPSRLADLLKRKSIDVGLVPSIALPAIGSGAIIPDISISSNGEVLSVLLVSSRPVDQLTSLALDTSSLSSVALAKVLCYEKFAVRPRFINSPPDLSVVGDSADGLVIIGDPAMLFDPITYPYVYDLGFEWTEWTGLPFVYAFWLSADPTLDPSLIEALTQAKIHGLSQISDIAREESVRLGLPEEVCRNYLAEKISYNLGEAELEGLRKYYELCHKHALCETVPSLNLCAV